MEPRPAPGASLSPPFHFHRLRRLLGLSAKAQQWRASLYGSGTLRGKGRERSPSTVAGRVGARVGSEVPLR